MRKELYKALCERLGSIVDGDGNAAIKHIDLWNHNVEFIEQEESWDRPAVFIEFAPIDWHAIRNGVEYRCEAEVRLHVVTDWSGSVSAGSAFADESLKVFDLLDEIHAALTCMHGDTFAEFDLIGSQTNHNHEDIVENVEVYGCVGMRRLCNS